MTKTSAGANLTLAPDTDYLSDPNTTYPVTIDPTWSSVDANDTWVQSSSPTAKHPLDASLYAGTKTSGSTKYRSFLQFVTTGRPWIGQVVSSANLAIRNYETNGCTGSAVRVSRVVEAYDNGNVTWNTQPTVTSTGSSDSWGSHGAAGCPAEDMNWNVTSIVQSWAAGGTNYGLRVAGVDETVNSSYRAYRSDNYGGAPGTYWPKLSVTYNSYPNTPTGFTVSPSVSSWTSSATPTLSAVVSDPDGGSVWGYFKVYDGSNLVWSGTTPSATGAGVASGSRVSIQVPAGKLVENKAYKFVAYSKDASVYSGKNQTSGGYAQTTLTVDTTKPGATVTSSAYTNGQWLESAPSSNTFSLDGDGDVTSFKITKDGAASTVATNTGDAVLSWNPGNGGHSLVVTPVDRAGNNGTPVTFAFGNGTAALDLPIRDDRSSSTFPVQASAPPGATSAKIQWRFAPEAADPETGWTDASALEQASNGSPWSGSVTTNATGGSATPALVWDPHQESGLATSTALVEVRVVFAYSGGAVKTSPVQRIQLVPHAFGGSFPTSDAGPGQVALFTGEFQYSEDDVDVPGYRGDLTLSRSHLSMAGTPAGPAGVFGPGWKADLAGPDEGVGGFQVVDRTAQDGSITLLSPEGDSHVYRHVSGTAGAQQPGDYAGVGETAEQEDTLSLAAVSGEPGITHRLTLTEWDGTKTIFVRTLDSSGDATWTTEQVAGTEDNATTRYAHDTDGDVTWIFAPSPAGQACDATSQQAGCRALHLNYDTVPAGGGTAKRLVSVDLRIYNPHTGTDGLPGAGAGMDTIPVAKYSYNSAGQLAATWDPRIADGSDALKTQYDYDTVNGHTVLATLTEPGLQPWTFHYDTSGAGVGRLTSITRPQDPGVGGGDATWTVRYDLPLSGGGLPDLTGSSTATWGQPAADAPAGGAAVFGPDHVPPASPAADDYEYADLSYWTQSGRVTNTAGYGAGAWQLDSQRYDTQGNVVWQLTAQGRDQALAEGGTDEETAAAGDKYATLTVYDAAGTRVEETYSPTRDFILENGTHMTGRTLTQTVYDGESEAVGYMQGRPDTDIPDGGFGLPVREFASATDISGPGAPGSLFDTKETRYRYDPIQTGDGDGWQLKTPTQVLTQDGAGWSTTSTRFDTEGKITETKTPQANASTGTAADARTTRTVYYTTQANAVRPACGNKPEWAGEACWHGTAGAPSSGAPIPDQSTAGYSTVLAPSRVVESSGAASRVSTTAYDAAGRSTDSSVSTSGLATADRAVPGTTLTYSSTTGLPITQSNGSQTQTTSYDSWGRVVTQTDGTGNTATTTYDNAGRVAAQDDGKGTYAYTYNGTDARGKKERRGLPTSLDVDLPSGPDVFTGAYDASGRLVEQNYPGGITASWSRDIAGNPTGLGYSQSGTDLLGFSQTLDRDGRVRQNTGPASSQAYSYDDQDRLTKVQDTIDGQCTTRVYDFSKDSNRVGLSSYAPDTTAGNEGHCQTTADPSSTSTSTFDDADRITSGAYSYDALGRTTTIPGTETSGGLSNPGNVSVTYHANDMVATLVQSGTQGGMAVTQTQEVELDSVGRVSTISSATNGDELATTTNHYADLVDGPAWIEERARPDAATPWTIGWSRNIVGLDGLIAATQDSDGTTSLQLSNIHGDIVAMVTAGEAGVAAFESANEYGVTHDSEAAPRNGRYGWLGSMARQSGDVLGGLVLMGARLYNPNTGRFLSRDSVEGGNENAYTYPGDPINDTDITGLYRYSVWYANGKSVEYTHWVTVYNIGIQRQQYRLKHVTRYQIRYVYRGTSNRTIGWQTRQNHALWRQTRVCVILCIKGKWTLDEQYTTAPSRIHFYQGEGGGPV